LKSLELARKVEKKAPVKGEGPMRNAQMIAENQAKTGEKKKGSPSSSKKGKHVV